MRLGFRTGEGGKGSRNPFCTPTRLASCRVGNKGEGEALQGSLAGWYRRQRLYGTRIRCVAAPPTSWCQSTEACRLGSGEHAPSFVSQVLCDAPQRLLSLQNSPPLPPFPTRPATQRDALRYVVPPFSDCFALSPCGACCFCRGWGCAGLVVRVRGGS